MRLTLSITMLRSQATQEAPLHDHFLKVKGVQLGRKGVETEL